jgi:hypothetical protein
VGIALNQKQGGKKADCTCFKLLSYFSLWFLEHLTALYLLFTLFIIE